MKKLFLISSIVVLPLALQAQSAYDALRYSQIFYTGTARSAAMGNAMTALGGDFGSLTINPAGSALYPYAEFTFTPLITNTVTKSDYLSLQSDQNRAAFKIANMGYVVPFSSSNSSIGMSFGVGYNALNDFTDRSSASGKTDQSSWLAALAYNTSGMVYAQDMDDTQNPFQNLSPRWWRSVLAWNTSLLDTIPHTDGMFYTGATEAYGKTIDIPGALQQDFFRESKGYLGEYVINFGLNFSHQLFLGANIGIQSLEYKYKQKYSESVVNPNDFYQTEFSNFTHTYDYNTSGIGLNLKFGIIWVPVQNLRFGATISTPTWMSLTDEWEETITANFQDGYHQRLSSPVGEYSYQISTPFRWGLGMAYTFGSAGAFSIDYEQAAYNKIYMSAESGSRYSNPFSEENDYIKKEFQNTHNLRTGLEFNLNEEFSLRGGYAFFGAPEKSNPYQTHIASLGIGLHSGSFFADITFMQRLAQQEYYTLYDDVYDSGSIWYRAPEVKQTTSNWKLLITLGVRF
ncbi:MAG: hypothetical protein LBC84_06060 [Prevotellaceae bacterium]|jgi:hypothetical protein|nr:hypothetical protein [Prevotellaceae bacterium]